MDQWVVVLDKDAVSTEQLAVCRALKPALRGAIACDDPDNAENAVCQQVDFFPAFCHVPSSQCVYGLRATNDALDALLTLPASGALTPPSTSTSSNATTSATTLPEA
jgi:hypothetical protein